MGGLYCSWYLILSMGDLFLLFEIVDAIDVEKFLHKGGPSPPFSAYSGFRAVLEIH